MKPDMDRIYHQVDAIVTEGILNGEEHDVTTDKLLKLFEPLLTYVNRHGKVLEHVAQERLNRSEVPDKDTVKYHVGGYKECIEHAAYYVHCAEVAKEEGRL